jgi:DNA replication and repair protein RecF
MQPLTLERISVRHVKNLEAVDLTFGPRFHVLSGDNGQGKTNLLDAIYLLATSRSFRGSKPEDIVQHGQEVASVRGVLVESGLAREQSVGVKKGMRSVRIDDKRPRTLVEYAGKTPVVVFHPGDIDLPSGSGSERRRLLDRVALHREPVALEELERYTRASRERQRALVERGPGARDLPEWEELMARHGVVVMRARREAAGRLAVAAQRAFVEMAPVGVTLEVLYVPGAPEEESAFREALERSRPADARRGSAKVGPHRDDLSLSLGGQRVKGVASQGQQRLVVLALKAAEMDVVEQARGARPILLLDDVSSELDRERTKALFAFIGKEHGQVFLTTTRPELIDTDTAEHAERRDYKVDKGQVLPVPLNTRKS